MAYDINADSYPDYDEWFPDDYWSITDWQTFYDKLIQKYGADEGSRRWLDAWHRQSWGANPMNARISVKDWGASKGLWSNDKNNFYLPAEFVPPLVTNQGQSVTTIDPKTGLPVTKVIGEQENLQNVQKSQEEKKEKVNKGLLIGGGVLVLGLTIAYFVLKAKNKAQ
jgi:hypothetical protein